MARLTATISVINPTAGVSFALPVVQVGYILMAVQADTDTGGRYKIIFDLVSVSDLAILGIGKGVVEQQAWTDVVASKVAKRLSDSQRMADSVYRAVRKATQDSVLVSAQSVRQVGKRIIEQQVLVDTVSRQVAKSLIDSQPVFSDRQIRAVNKLMPVNYYTLDDYFQDNYVADAWADFANMQDSISQVVQYRRVYQDTSALLDQQNLNVSKLVRDNFASVDTATLLSSKLVRDNFNQVDQLARGSSKGLKDSQNLSDAVALSHNKLTVDNQHLADALSKTAIKALTDVQPATDYKNWQLNKVLQDAFGVNDTAVIGDGVAFTANKFATNIFIPLDRYTSTSTKALTDTATAIDAGFLVSQSYSEMSYFAVDYVGASRSF